MASKDILGSRGTVEEQKEVLLVELIMFRKLQDFAALKRLSQMKRRKFSNFFILWLLYFNDFFK